jgi:hypothetical protein
MELSGYEVSTGTGLCFCDKGLSLESTDADFAVFAIRRSMVTS